MSVRVVIPSACAGNLIACVQSVLACESAWSPSTIIVVDDGAKADSNGSLPSVTWVRGVKPFIFARNVNRGIAAAGTDDVILMNDDARLVTQAGFTMLSHQMQAHPEVGVCSVGIQGIACNSNQIANQPSAFRYEPDQLAFICVYLTRTAIDRVGLLDERFTGYGFEDFDYCRRVRAEGLHLAVWDGCVVDHVGDLPSTFRTRANLPQLFNLNHQLYDEKWTGSI